MSRRLALAPLFLIALGAALGLPALAPPARAATPAAPPAGTEAPAGASDGSAPFTVYLPPPPRARPLPRRPVPPPESGLAVGLAAAVFLAAGLAWLGLRPPACPRCRQKLVRLEPAGAPADPPASGTAAPPGSEGRERGRREPWACLGCGVVMRRRFGPLVVRDAACPRCGAPTRRAALAVVDRPGYLTWGEVRIDEDCLSCPHRATALYAAPPLEAPTAQRGTAETARGATSRYPRP